MLHPRRLSSKVRISDFRVVNINKNGPWCCNIELGSRCNLSHDHFQETRVCVASSFQYGCSSHQESETFFSSSVLFTFHEVNRTCSTFCCYKYVLTLFTQNVAESAVLLLSSSIRVTNRKDLSCVLTTGKLERFQPGTDVKISSSDATGTQQLVVGWLTEPCPPLQLAIIQLTLLLEKTLR